MRKATEIKPDSVLRKWWRTVPLARRRYFIPRFVAYLILLSRLFDKTFEARVRRRLAFDRRKVLVTLCDKIAVRDYVRQRAPQLKLTQIYQIVEDASSLDPSQWPDEFVVKPAHGSGALVMVTKEPREGLRYDIETQEFRWDRGTWGMLSSDLDLDTLKRLAKNWLSSGYEYWTYMNPEWAYRNVPRRVMVEELVTDKNLVEPLEVRFHCFHGKVEIARITDTISLEKKAWTLCPSGELLGVRLSSDPPNPGPPPPLPWTWSKAIEIAEQVSHELDYVRVDFFLGTQSVTFSEMTPYPNGGARGIDFEPKSVSQLLAKKWGNPAYSTGRITDFASCSSL